MTSPSCDVEAMDAPSGENRMLRIPFRCPRSMLTVSPVAALTRRASFWVSWNSRASREPDRFTSSIA